MPSLEYVCDFQYHQEYEVAYQDTIYLSLVPNIPATFLDVLPCIMLIIMSIVNSRVSF